MKTEHSQHNPQDKAEAFIALAAQPSEATKDAPSPDELANFFENSKQFSKQRQEQILAYLDSNPQAYNRWIKQGKTARQSSRMPLMLSIAPYALATFAVLLIAGVLLSRGQTFQLDKTVDHAYQVAFLNEDSDSLQRTMASFTDSLERQKQPLSFSQSGKLSPMAQTFLLGLKHDWQSSDQPLASSDLSTSMQQEDYQLGRWYALLWIVSQQNKTLPTNFWQEQLNLLDHLQTHYNQRLEKIDTAEIRAIAIQLENMQETLSKLAENSQDTKPYKQLEKTLTALRYSLVPSF